MGIITSLTAQNTEAIKRIHCPSPRFVSEQYRQLHADVEFSGIKVGMIGCEDNISVIAEILSDNQKKPVVIDPVFKSSGGNWLFDKKSIPEYMARIKGKASVLTPNLLEAEWISGLKVRNPDEMHTSAERIYDLTSIPCLVKGGHLQDQKVDILFDGKTFVQYKNKMLKKAVHGTGCFLSSSILCYMVKGSTLDQAVSLAIKDTHKAIKKAVKVGKGQHTLGDVP